ncbi:MAG: GAF domain-containing protein [Corynebacterium sp.]|uniref:GAF domain-containing protein n=1 Tax=Corynebacterium sp. TaxID=1720 RepID=UPI0026DB049C|nr:GAF domain-containing protein [Corynebacterium sp.]MDO4761798.1 GAF domain-containing protein [Corynebacterium sp.]
MHPVFRALDDLLANKPLELAQYQELTSSEIQILKKLEHQRNDDLKWRSSAQMMMKTASELARVHNSEELLDSIVTRARTLLSSDIAYISLNDERTQTTYIFATSGVMTTDFKEIRLPLGVGILGKAAKLGTTVFTHDHQTDPSVTHDPLVDEAVNKEGVRGILAAPLMSNTEVIGALLVGDRVPRVYNHIEMATLTGLASLASVALETAHTVADLEKAKATNLHHIGELQTLANADEQLFASLNSTDFEEIARILKACLHTDVAIFSGFPDHKNATSHTGKFCHTGDFQPSWTNIHHMLTQPEENTHELTIIPALIGNRLASVIVVNGALNDIEEQIVNRARSVLIAQALFEEGIETALRYQVDSLMRSIVRGNYHAREFETLQNLAGVDLGEHPWVIATSHGCPRLAKQLRGHIKKCFIVLEHNDHLCILSNRDGLYSMEKLLATRTDLYAGAVALSKDTSNAEDAHEKALQIASSMHRLGRSSEIGTLQKLGSLGILLNNHEVDTIIHAQLGNVLAYDLKNCTQLVETLFVYFEKDKSVAETAKHLYVHQNTVRQRIAKAGELLGGKINGSYALDVHIALRAWALKNTTS